MPSRTDVSPDDAKHKVEAVMTLLRPSIQADGGDVEVVSVEDGIVRVRFSGACIACPSKGNTMRHGLLKAIQERVPGIVDVLEAA
ncbi:MAG: NifU family protein [Planctomycetota bacterium]|nr:NifU family protein [Planctomycetota bacterium]MDA1105998.1 NifU family protein [Planctomycetota bacterium]